MMSRLALLMLAASAAQAADIAVVGDSWGSYGKAPFVDLWKRKGSNNTVENIAISGTTANQWAHQYKNDLIRVVSKPDVKVVWVTLGGNDAKNFLPFCALSGGSSEQCIDEVIEKFSPMFDIVLQTIKDANPKARVVAFGYDIFGLGADNGPLCEAIPLGLLPGCKGNVSCFNTYYERLQGAVESIQKRHVDQMDVVNLLGSIQAGAGVPDASVGHPNLARWSPAKYMEANCIHPNSKGYKFLFDAFWDLYLHKYN